jgi:DNA-binding FrmR family transcriptional regulator
MNDCTCQKKKHREGDELRSLQNRLRRIEGQIRGLQNMLAEDAYCTDILTQVTAVQAALNAFSKELLGSHIRTCVVNDVRAGDNEVIDDLIKMIYRLMK